MISWGGNFYAGFQRHMITTWNTLCRAPENEGKRFIAKHMHNNIALLNLVVK
ncbi:hypothetical protein JG687_00004023 [Phytophthora cactorum]|uniref:Uncharacterized protein n=1 Tax=Phytophthora cactorum TaxID=29920 RepID=A0A8T1UUE1_9STRA|nr:hypothetical protein PC120_g2688 [Phytophthora cactorum]KAG3098775.1 hypothetical protein PC121_g2011 [Phytophthora cactorum]KAG3204821.1 hypothetical protein PC128_g1744 [Phytophthora cactorum]KAG4063988.1 hypothetical protein PC123_g1204 [Phytophthora cactorum]KAG6967899.1 hypothetical protein JG687_00004023 [Phytophthora cactorum]